MEEELKSLRIEEWKFNFSIFWGGGRLFLKLAHEAIPLKADNSKHGFAEDASAHFARAELTVDEHY